MLPPGEPAFNISHTGHHALIVIARAGPVGVDLETTRTIRIAGPRRALLDAAACALANENGVALDENRRLLIGWTAIEAVAKALGSGVGQVLTELGITAAGARTLSADQVADRARRLATSAGLRVLVPAMPAGLHAAIALPASWQLSSVVVRPLEAADCRLRLNAPAPA